MTVIGADGQEYELDDDELDIDRWGCVEPPEVLATASQCPAGHLA